MESGDRLRLEQALQSLEDHISEGEAGGGGGITNRGAVFDEDDDDEDRDYDTHL